MWLSKKKLLKNKTMEEQQEIKKEEVAIKIVKEPVQTGLEQVGRNKDGTFKEGVSGNPAGRKKGSKDFTTILNIALKKIAEEKNIDPNSVEVGLVLRAVAEANRGNYKYHKDIFDRKYGKAQEHIDHTTNGQEIEGVKVEIVKGIIKKPDDTKENNQDEGDDTVREEP